MSIVLMICVALSEICTLYYINFNTFLQNYEGNFTLISKLNTNIKLYIGLCHNGIAFVFYLPMMNSNMLHLSPTKTPPASSLSSPGVTPPPP